MFTLRKNLLGGIHEKDSFYFGAGNSTGWRCGHRHVSTFLWSSHQYPPQPSGPEQPFIFAMAGPPVPLIGIYDLVLEDAAGVITIVDHKTASKAYFDE